MVWTSTKWEACLTLVDNIKVECLNTIREDTTKTRDNSSSVEVAKETTAVVATEEATLVEIANNPAVVCTQ